MNMENLIPIPILCAHYEVEMSFFTNLNEMGLLEIKTIETSQYIDSDVNIEGIDIVFNLLQKIDMLQNELTALKNRLRLYES